MPAVELNSFPAEATYDMAKQKAMFKLWLILTTDQFTVGDGVRLFNTTEEAEDFKRASEDIPDRIFYLDLEQIVPQLQPLDPDDVIRIFNTLMQDNRDFLQEAADLFHQTAKDPCEYGPGACITVQEPMDICLPVPEAVRRAFLDSLKDRRK